MRTVNTTAGSREYDTTRPGHVVNTSRIVEEDLVYEDEEPTVVQILNADGWVATFEDGHQENLIFWCLLDDATVHGVVLGERCRVDLTEGNVEKDPGFAGYVQVSQHKENQ